MRKRVSRSPKGEEGGTFLGMSPKVDPDLSRPGFARWSIYVECVYLRTRFR